MPSNVVKDEHLWDKAKGIVKKQYPKVAEGSDRFYRLVMGIYKKMKGEKSMFASYPVLQEALEKAQVAHSGMGTGKLSEATRERIGRAGEKKRKDIPAHVFLLPGQRKYPVKDKVDGKWVYSLKLLLAAARRARMQKRPDLAARADKIRERLQNAEKSVIAADYPMLEKARIRAHQRRTKTGKMVQVREYETARPIAGGKIEITRGSGGPAEKIEYTTTERVQSEIKTRQENVKRMEAAQKKDGKDRSKKIKENKAAIQRLEEVLQQTKPAAFGYDEKKMSVLVGKDAFLKRAFLGINEKLEDRSKALKIIYNTYVKGDSVMERRYAGKSLFSGRYPTLQKAQVKAYQRRTKAGKNGCTTNI